VYNIYFTNLKSFSLLPTFPSPMILASPAVPQIQETRKVCVSTLLPNQYAQMLLISVCTNASDLLQIIQPYSSTMVPDTDYSDIGFYCSYRL